MYPRLLACLLAAAASAPAQQIATFPSDHATIPDGRSSIHWYPYSYGVSRMQAVYEAWDLNIPAGRQITRIGVRADGNRLSYGRALQLEVRMGQSDRTAATLTNNFANNYFGNPVTVFGPALFTLPDLNNPLNPNPDGAYVWLTLTTPYTYDPTRNLLVEWRILANNNGGASFTYYLDSADFESPIVSGPVGCTHSGNQIPTLESRRTRVGGTWYCDLQNAPANQFVRMYLNVGSALVPPYSLAGILPGIGVQCRAQVTQNNLFTIDAMTNNAGYHTFIVPVPNDRLLNDLIVSSQVLCTDFFSPGGYVVSNGDQIQLGIEPATAMVYHQGSATNATGSVTPSYNVVTFFQHN